MATAAQHKTPTRLVVIIQQGEKKRLQKRAREEQVSSSELVRRLIHYYEFSSQKEQREVKSLLAEMNQSLDKALESVRSARTEVAANLSEIKKRKATRA